MLIWILGISLALNTLIIGRNILAGIRGKKAAEFSEPHVSIISRGVRTEGPRHWSDTEQTLEELGHVTDRLRDIIVHKHR